MVGKITPINSGFCPWDSKIVISLIFAYFYQFFCDKEPRSTISTQVAASICYAECYLDILSRRSENSASLILCILKFLAILQNFMGALKIDGSKAKYISDQICLLINFTYMNRQYLDGQQIIYDPMAYLIMPGLLVT